MNFASKIRWATSRFLSNAEKDMDLRVENDSREFIGANRSLIVTTNQLGANPKPTSTFMSKETISSRLTVTCR